MNANKETTFEKRYRLVREVIETLVLTILMFLVIRLAVQNFNIEGISMEPSLHDQELILVDKWSYLFHPPNRGDVLVFQAPPAPGEDYIKRVIGLPGDIITIHDTTVTLDGVTLNETYVNAAYQGNPYSAKVIENLRVPDNEYFVMGDDRKYSSDSRDWGFLPRQNIIGRAAFVYWPLQQDNDGFLPNVSAVFANIHQSSSTSSIQSQGYVALLENLQANVLLFTLLPSLSMLSYRRNGTSRDRDTGRRRVCCRTYSP